MLAEKRKRPGKDRKECLNMLEIQISKEKTAALYRTMKLIRCFEESVKRD